MFYILNLERYFQLIFYPIQNEEKKFVQKVNFRKSNVENEIVVSVFFVVETKSVTNSSYTIANSETI